VAVEVRATASTLPRETTSETARETVAVSDFVIVRTSDAALVCAASTNFSTERTTSAEVAVVTAKTFPMILIAVCVAVVLGPLSGQIDGGPWTPVVHGLAEGRPLADAVHDPVDDRGFLDQRPGDRNGGHHRAHRVALPIGP
jgi:hypothetical protein